MDINDIKARMLDRKKGVSMEQNNHSCSFPNELHLEKACIECLKADCIKACQIISNDICSQQIDTVSLNADTSIINNLCVPTKFQAKNSYVDKSYNNILSAQSATFDNACITNLSATNINSFVKYKAAVTNSATSVYNLGAPLNWDTILDDPNGNVSTGPFTYTVPVNGYYVLTVHLNSNNLAGAAVITGTPVGLINTLVNGNPLRSETTPYLSFADNQTSTLTSICLLTAGDVITMNYQILVFTVAGLTPYLGTVDILANGGFPGESGFAIHYLSSLSGAGPVCTPAQPVTITCQPVTISCRPVCCGDNTIKPCESCC
jgi:hypothetical protein